MKNYYIFYFVIIGLSIPAASLSLSQYQNEKALGLVVKPDRYRNIVVSLDQEIDEDLPRILNEIPGLDTLTIKGRGVAKITNWSRLNDCEKIRKIKFSEGCELKEVPLGLARLNFVRSISFKDNPIRYLPKEMTDFLARKNTRINLKNTLLRFEDSDENLGALQLRPFGQRIRFPDRVSMYGSEAIYPQKMAHEINGFFKEYQSSASLTVDPQKLRQAIYKKNDQAVLSWLDFWREFEELIDSFDVDNPAAKNYVSFDFFRESIEELDPSIRGLKASNAELMRTKVFPRLRGFAKALYGKYPNQNLGEYSGAQPHPWDVDQVQIALGHAIKDMNAIVNPADKTARFVQLKGLLHCVEGYIEAINTINYGDEEWKTNSSDWENKVRRMIAAEKREAFAYAAVDNDFEQSAHQAAFYGYYLRSAIGMDQDLNSIYESSDEQSLFNGLTSRTRSITGRKGLKNYYGLSERDVLMGETNPDDQRTVIFLDSKSNRMDRVLSIFFKLFSPTYMAKQLLNYFETAQDFNRMTKFNNLFGTGVLSKIRNLRDQIRILENERDIQEAKFQQELTELNDRISQDRMRENFSDEIEYLYEMNRSKDGDSLECALFRQDRDQYSRFAEHIYFAEREIGLLQEEWSQIARGFEQKISVLNAAIVNANNEAENEQLAKLARLGKKVNGDTSSHPLKFGELFNYLKSKGHIYFDTNRDTYVNFEKYFDRNTVILDSFGDPIYATLHLLGAKQVLVDMGYLRYHPLAQVDAKDIKKQTVLEVLAHRINDIYGTYNDHLALDKNLLANRISERSGWLFARGEEAIKEALRENTVETGLIHKIQSDVIASQELLGVILEEALAGSVLENREQILALIPDAESLKILLNLKFLDKENRNIDGLSDEDLLIALLDRVIEQFPSERDLAENFEIVCGEENSEIEDKYRNELKKLDSFAKNTAAEENKKQALQKYLFFSDILTLLTNNGLIGEFDPICKTYSQIEKYFDLDEQTQLVDSEGRLLYAPFRSKANNLIGIELLLEDLAIIIDGVEDFQGVLQQMSLLQQERI